MKQHNIYPKSNNLKTLKAAAAIAIASTGIGATKASAEPNPWQAEKTAEFMALTKVIDGLEQGKPVNISVNPVELPGPIDDATARPIVFQSGGQTYFAYRQGKEPDFNKKTATDVAAEMALVKEPRDDEGMGTATAVLNKEGVLVDQNQQAVGYSLIPND